MSDRNDTTVLEIGQHRVRKSIPEYGIWMGMICRCNNKNSKSYKNYGGRGIRVCDEWRKDFWAFYRHIGKRPTRKHTVERIDTNGNYEPGNVRWATRTEQARNTTKNVTLSHQGTTATVAEWAERLGIRPTTIYYRLDHNWPIEKALNSEIRNPLENLRPPKDKHGPAAKLTEESVRKIRVEFSAGSSMASLGKRYGVSRSTIQHVVHRRTWADIE